MISALIDHTLLKADATADQIRKLCEEAREYGFATVCVNSYWVPSAAAQGVKVCTVVGFPLGAASTAAKVAETERAVRDGALEIDMVINIGELKGGNDDAVQRDIEAVAWAAHRSGAILKVIIETALLDHDQKVSACRIAKAAGAEFVKTSTGFSTGGATVHDVTLMRATVGKETGVKASGGIRTFEDLNQMVAAGATRIGTSAGVAIMQAKAASQGGY